MSALGGPPPPRPAATPRGSARMPNSDSYNMSCGPVQCGPWGCAGLRDGRSCPAGISRLVGDLRSTRGQTTPAEEEGGRGRGRCLSWWRSGRLKANILSSETRADLERGQGGVSSGYLSRLSGKPFLTDPSRAQLSAAVKTPQPVPITLPAFLARCCPSAQTAFIFCYSLRGLAESLEYGRCSTNVC